MAVATGNAVPVREELFLNEEEFKATCLGPGRLRPIATLVERERQASTSRRLSDSKMKAAEVLLGTVGEQSCVGEAYFAMEHKVNELLAAHGWKSKSHLCTIVALTRLLALSDLARDLSRAYADRQQFDYTADPGDLGSADSYGGFLAFANAFRKRVDEEIAKVQS